MSSRGGELCAEYLWSLMSLWTYTEVMGEVDVNRLGSGQHPGLHQGLDLIWLGEGDYTGVMAH